MKANKIIEFTGIPNSGKTTLIHRLKEELPSKYGITVQVQREDAEIVPSEIPKKTWDRNLWITFGQLQSLVQAYHSDADIVLLDRGFFDAMFWSSFMLEQNITTSNQSYGVNNILFQTYYNLDFHPDYLFLFDTSIEESIRRHLLMGGNCIYSNPDFLNNYRDHFFTTYKKYIDGNKNITFFYDTTNLTPDELFDKVASQIRIICDK